MKKMILETGRGVIEYTESDVVLTENGILGFEHLKRYVMKRNFRDSGFTMIFSIDDPSVMFPLLPSYAVKSMMSETDKFFIMFIMNGNFEESTVNTRAPLVVTNYAPYTVEQEVGTTGAVNMSLKSLLTGEKAA